MEAYINAWRTYAEFRGRTSRVHYWWFVLFNFSATVLLLVLGVLIHAPFLLWLYALAILLPNLAIQCRRLHDTGRSAWWLLIGLVPLAGAIVLLVFYLLPGDAGSNAYGVPDMTGAGN